MIASGGASGSVGRERGGQQGKINEVLIIVISVDRVNGQQGTDRGGDLRSSGFLDRRLEFRPRDRVLYTDHGPTTR